MKRLVTLAVIAIAASNVLAGPLNPAQVPADAKWVFHFDTQKFVASKTGAAMIEEGNKQGLDVMIGAVKGAVGVDLLKDLRDVTAWGTEPGEHTGVMLLNGTFDQEKIVKALRLNKSFKETKYADHATYKWTDPPKGGKPAEDHYGAFAGKETAVVASSQALLHKALDVLDGKASAADPKAVAGMANAVMGLAVTSVNPPAGKPEMAFLKKMSSGSMILDEAEGTVVMRVTMAATDDKAADELVQMGEGFKAMLQLVSPPKDDPAAGKGLGLPQIQAAINGMKIAKAGTVVTMEASAPAEDVVALIRHVAAEKRGEKK